MNSFYPVHRGGKTGGSRPIRPDARKGKRALKMTLVRLREKRSLIFVGHSQETKTGTGLYFSKWGEKKKGRGGERRGKGGKSEWNLTGEKRGLAHCYSEKKRGVRVKVAEKEKGKKKSGPWGGGLLTYFRGGGHHKG